MVVVVVVVVVVVRFAIGSLRQYAYMIVTPVTRDLLLGSQTIRSLGLFHILYPRVVEGAGYTRRKVIVANLLL